MMVKFDLLLSFCGAGAAWSGGSGCCKIVDRFYWGSRFGSRKFCRKPRK